MLHREQLENLGLLTTQTQSVYDPLFTRLLQALPWAQWYQEPDPLNCREEYLQTYKVWIAKSSLNKVYGLDRFHRLDLINGTTQTFDEAYFKYADKRLRVFRGEYGYHRRVLKNIFFIEDGPLEKNDYLIISAPFCSSGDLHPNMNEILDRAALLEVPVIVDCAYFGTCYGIEFDLRHPAIESVSFSLTKGAGLGHIRSGIRFSNLQDQYPICQQNNYNHTVLAAARIGLYMMQNTDPDFIPTKYVEMQRELCAELSLSPSKCIHIALGDDAWESYRIDGAFNRVGLAKLIKAKRKGHLP